MKRNLRRLAIIAACVPNKTPGLSNKWGETDDRMLAVFFLWTSSYIKPKIDWARHKGDR